ncbi:MAG TPA: adenylate cyclase [Actinomycetota bacterium]|nr:adenylate cyclase [Actinomycetota bacterium]
MADPKRRPALTGEQLQEVLGLMKGADSVELKLTVPEGNTNATVKALGIDPLDARVRQVFFFDTHDLKLNDAGVVVRARRIQDSAADTVVKMRPVIPDEIAPELRTDPSFGVEVDAMPGGYVCSASLKGTSTNAEVWETAAGGRPPRKLFSKAQRRYFEANAPKGIGLDDVSVLGPVNLLKLKFKPKELERKMAVELWFYPNGSRILELSTKCAPAEAFQVAAEAQAYLSGRGIDLTGEQQTKTKSALMYFSKVLAQAAR